MASQTQITSPQLHGDWDVRPKVAIQAITPTPRRRVRVGVPLDQASSISTVNIGLAKRTRKSASKSKSGCQTCKIRHIKCDETTPACIKCAETGRSCDFLKNTVTKYLSPSYPSQYALMNRPSSPPTILNIAQQDVVYFDYFRSAIADNFATPFDTDLWTIVLQACHSEPCILHAILGTAMKYRIYPFIIENPGNPIFIDVHRSAFKHYVHAVKCTKERLANVNGELYSTTWEISLLSSFLFTFFEVLAGNEEGAYWQFLNGFGLMKTALSLYDVKSTTLNLPGNLQELAFAFNRIDIQAATFQVGHAPHLFLPSNVPNTFLSLSHARNTLEVVCIKILSVVRSRGRQFCIQRRLGQRLPQNLATQVSDLEAILQSWLVTFEHLLLSIGLDLDKTGTPESMGVQRLRGTIASKTLMAQYWTAFIWIRTPFSPVETVYDPYLPAFRTITDLAGDIITLCPWKKKNYAADSQIIQPLFYVAQRCRDGKVRRRACNLLTDAGREGVWDGKCMAAACSWIIEKEEEGLGGKVGHCEAGREGFVEEQFRLIGANINLNRLGRTLRIRCSRRREDGTDEIIEGSVDWGEVNGVVYGEADKLWQFASIF